MEKQNVGQAEGEKNSKFQAPNNKQIRSANFRMTKTCLCLWHSAISCIKTSRKTIGVVLVSNIV